MSDFTRGTALDLAGWQGDGQRWDFIMIHCTETQFRGRQAIWGKEPDVRLLYRLRQGRIVQSYPTAAHIDIQRVLGSAPFHTNDHQGEIGARGHPVPGAS